MPRQSARRQILNFVGGLNTEASPLIFPEGTAKDLDNIDLNRDGSIRRRRGIDFELTAAYSEDSFSESDLQNYAISAHEWKSVDGDDNLNFLVIQIGGVLYFHNLGEDSFSQNPIGKIDLAPIKVRSDYEEFVISASVGRGKFFVVSRGISPSYIQYDEDSNTFSGIKLTIKVRDIDGIDEDRDSPTVFGNDVTPDETVDPEDDFQDVLEYLEDIDFGEFIIINPGGTIV